jgi:hypothetical protein
MDIHRRLRFTPGDTVYAFGGHADKDGRRFAELWIGDSSGDQPLVVIGEIDVLRQIAAEILQSLGSVQSQILGEEVRKAQREAERSRSEEPVWVPHYATPEGRRDAAKRRASAKKGARTRAANKKANAKKAGPPEVTPSG